MAERPIRCYAHEVRAILAGAKTQTRRVVKPQPQEVHDGKPYWYIGGYRAWKYQGAGDALRMGTGNPIACPYGAPGDVLWVRETWAPCEAPIRSGFYQYAADGAVGRRVSTSDGADFWARNGHTIGISDDSLLGVWVGQPSRWRPSIHMPRAASRLSLRIKSVRVERLQEISDVDAISEGIAHNVLRDGGYSLPDTSHYHASDPRASFCSLWDSINGAGSWAANPWVWVVDSR